MNRFKNNAFALVLAFELFVVAISATADPTLTVDDARGTLASITPSKAANGVTVLSDKPLSGLAGDSDLGRIQMRSGTYILSEPSGLVLLGAALVSVGAWGRRRMKRKTNSA
jgi:hypothetical protein